MKKLRIDIRKVKICLVVPCYNESQRLHLPSFERAIIEDNVHFIFVNDGSVDATSEVLASFQQKHPDHIQVLDNKLNMGKGNAVRKGMLHASFWMEFDYLGYWDADLSTPFSELQQLVAPMMEGEYLFCFGSRLLRIGGEIKRNGLRHYVSRISATFAAETLNLPVYDTQCGAKLFSADVLEAFFKEPFLSSWLFDVEIFFRAKQLWNKKEFFNNTLEVPISKWTEVAGSRIRFNNVLNVPLELYRIRSFYKSQSW